MYVCVHLSSVACCDTVLLVFLVICMLQQLSMYIKSTQDYERERSLFIASNLLKECLTCAATLAVGVV